MTKQPSIESRVEVVGKKVAKLEQLAKGWDARLERRFMAEGEMMDERFANLYAYINKRFEGVDKQFEGVDKQFEGVGKQFEGVDKRLDGIDKRLEGIDTRFDSIDDRFDGIDRRFDGIDRELKLLREGMTIILAKLS